MSLLKESQLEELSWEELLSLSAQVQDRVREMERGALEAEAQRIFDKLDGKIYELKQDEGSSYLRVISLDKEKLLIRYSRLDLLGTISLRIEYEDFEYVASQFDELPTSSYVPEILINCVQQLIERLYL